MTKVQTFTIRNSFSCCSAVRLFGCSAVNNKEEEVRANPFAGNGEGIFVFNRTMLYIHPRLGLWISMWRAFLKLLAKMKKKKSARSNNVSLGFGFGSVNLRHTSAGLRYGSVGLSNADARCNSGKAGLHKTNARFGLVTVGLREAAVGCGVANAGCGAVTASIREAKAGKTSFLKQFQYLITIN